MTTATRGRRAPSPPPPYPGSTDNAIPYAYGGNKSYQPIGVDVAPGLDGFDYLMPDGTRKHIAFSELVAEDEKPERSKLLRRRLASLPQCVRRHFAAKLDALDVKDRKAADHWLLNLSLIHISEPTRP